MQHLSSKHFSSWNAKVSNTYFSIASAYFSIPTTISKGTAFPETSAPKKLSYKVIHLQNTKK